MQSATLYKLKTRAQKALLYSQEDIDLSKHLNVGARDIQIEAEPFPHFVAENFFKPETYQALCDQHAAIKARGFSQDKKNMSQFHLFDMDYDGYLYIPPPTLDPKNPLSIFFSLEWNIFFSRIFKQFTTFETDFAFHHHPAGDRTGFVHHDHNDMPFSSRAKLRNGVIYRGQGQTDIKSRRIISILYYLNNDDWRAGDGGGTGIYSADTKTLLKVVEPTNNTLFAFQTSPKSMHAFQTNKKPRNSMVQWFHVPPELLNA